MSSVKNKYRFIMASQEALRELGIDRLQLQSGAFTGAVLAAIAFLWVPVAKLIGCFAGFLIGFCVGVFGVSVVLYIQVAISHVANLCRQSDKRGPQGRAPGVTDEEEPKPVKE